MRSAERAETRMTSTLSKFDPCSRLRTVVYGIRTMLSWSSPTMLAPFFSSTPMTWNGMLRMRIVLPRGLVVWKSFATIVWPMTQTLAAEPMSRSVKKPPWRSGQLRTVRYSVPTPTISRGLQFVLP